MYIVDINCIKFKMKAIIQQENPYQIKSRRFKRTLNENQACTSQLSPSNIKSLDSVKSLQNLYTRQDIFDKQNAHLKIKGSVRGESIDKSSNHKKGGSSLQKRLKRKRNQHNEQQQKHDQSISTLKRIIMQKQQRIQELQILLDNKLRQNKEMQSHISNSLQLQEQTRFMQYKMREEIVRMQIRHSQEQFRLKQVIKKLQIDVSCINKRWSSDYDKLSKEKDLQIKTLKERITNLLRAKRLASKQNSVLNVNPSTISQPEFYRYDNQLLELSSFQLSKDDGLEN